MSLVIVCLGNKLSFSLTINLAFLDWFVGKECGYNKKIMKSCISLCFLAIFSGSGMVVTWFCVLNCFVLFPLVFVVGVT